MSANRYTRKAITFIELIIVVSIIAVLAGLSIPLIHKTADSLKLETFVKDTYYLCHYLQGSAISESRIYCLSINPREKNISVTYKNENDIFEQAQGKFARTRVIPEGISIANAQGIINIYFYPDGSMNEISLTFTNQYEHKVSLSTKGTNGVIRIE